MTDEELYKLIKKHLDRGPKYPIPVSKMTEQEGEIAKICSYHVGFLIWLKNVLEHKKIG